MGRMSDTPPPSSSAPASLPATAELPEAVAVPRRRSHGYAVWLIPILAALIGLTLGVRAWLATGPTVTITFKTAEDLEPGKTKIKYKNVDIGDVKSIALAPDGKGVVVTAEMTQGAQKLLLDDTRFWVVRARVAGSGVTGLSTLLSGAYIGIDIGTSSESRREFVGLDVPPSVTADEPGREFILRSADLGSVDIGSPVYFRRVQVGKVTATRLDADGRGVTLRVFISAPHEQHVTENTRFWHASGLDVALDAGGIKLQTQSLISIVLGGIAFGAPESGAPGAAAEAEHSFALFENQALAMKRTSSEVTPMVAHFTESLRGLAPGAQIDFRGVVVGEVTSIDVSYDRDRREFSFPVGMVLYSDRLGSKVSAAIERAQVDPTELMRRSIERGLRAQLRTANLLTGQRYVALDFFPGARPVKTAAAPAAGSEAPVLEIPTISGSLEDLQATLTSIAKRIENVPFDEIAADLRTALQSLDRTLKNTDGLIGRLDGQLGELVPELKAAIADTRRTMKSADNLLASDTPTQQELREALREVSRAAQSMRELTDYVQRRPESLLRGKPGEPEEGGKR
ncbi:PqiB family protein [Methylibium petroleiphilum]|uniref:Paraquat-inducible protein n=1 Tax=Methylibium petroleiphilum (strain ATCC BAA-1232 / LMG 22953 / PM1) TaxID=420662 RepID=A2SBR3_METPP|nr:paraquat-inducible protein [Methylibium petroleiphilum PM1]